MGLALVGVGLVALPTGILTTGFIRALRSEKKLTQLAESIEEEEKEQDELVERIEEIEKEIEQDKKTTHHSK